MLKAFGAPHAYVFDESGGGDTALIAACRRLGVKRMGSEIGGGGITSRGNIAMTEHGILRVLVHLGALSSDWIAELPDAHQSNFIRRAGARSDHYIYADENGVFEPFVELGDTVEANQAVGQILFPETPWRAPTTCTSKTSGIIICRRAKGRTARGDGVIVLGELLQAP
ncbi:succinylglutamate desuccinylase/aspartoacylase family protein [Rhizobium leguminosarum]|uniref:succinylglutamate desuccinylase/aspartoacylase family protein n=1 Tax=Rhizobium leguminosarum TaxID=384 RepID=UPI003B58ADD2